MFDQKIIERAITKYNWDVAIAYLESKKVNVPKYLIKCLILSATQTFNIESILYTIDNGSVLYQKYADEVEKYLMLV